MKEKNNGGFSLVEVLLAMMILAAIVIPVCSGILLSVRMDARANDVLQARVAVSSAVETLMAQGITHASNRYDFKIDEETKEEKDLFPDVSIETKAEPEDADPASYYLVTVKDAKSLVTVTTKIHAAPAASEENKTPADNGGAS